MNKDDKRNAEGYLDPTAYQAIKNVEKEDQANEDIRFHKLLDTIFTIFGYPFMVIFCPVSFEIKVGLRSKHDENV